MSDFIDRHMNAYVLLGDSLVRMDQIAAVTGGSEARIVLVSGATIDVAMGLAEVLKLIKKTQEAFYAAHQNLMEASNE